MGGSAPIEKSRREQADPEEGADAVFVEHEQDGFRLRYI